METYLNFLQATAGIVWFLTFIGSYSKTLVQEKKLFKALYVAAYETAIGGTIFAFIAGTLLYFLHITNFAQWPVKFVYWAISANFV